MEVLFLKKFLLGSLAVLLVTVGLNFSHTAANFDGDLELSSSVTIMGGGGSRGGHKDIGPMD